MENKYPFKKVESKWIDNWEKNKSYETKEGVGEDNFYALVEFPYPSGKGLHVGHPRSYTAMDVISRKKRMEGFNVLFPIGWDAFGLPAENFAIKTGTHPRISTEKNIDNFKRQLKSIGFSFDWSREINTTDPNYYKWTQWIFMKMFDNGLAYKKSISVNWCPSCNTVLANEEVIDGKCERCGEDVIRKERKQWMLKITEYADRLIEDLDSVEYPERVKKQQVDWIGKSEGATISFTISGHKDEIKVFTTRPDTIFGATFLVLSPENPLVKDIITKDNKVEVDKYIEEISKKTDLERTESQKDKTGVFTGAYAINPATKEEIPIWISEYVLMSYGTGAIMSVPAHDQRDFDFAKKHGLSIIKVIDDGNKDELRSAYEGSGIMINSGKFDGKKPEDAIDEMIKFVGGEKSIQYKLRDWVFSRQRYWGEPIPLVYCENCSEKINNKEISEKDLTKGEIENPGWISIGENNLPLKLPEIKDFKTTKEGDSPLAKNEDWVNVKCPKCGGNAKRETDTMPQWAGSSWYYMRYIDNQNNSEIADKNKIKKWLPVDWYNGGMEHTTLHLLYSRFWHKFLYDIGIVDSKEPYKKRTSHGMILGEGGEKMSKSRGNVINPDDIIDEFGADAFRVYEMFMGPFENAIPWSNESILGVERFLNRVWRIRERVSDEDIKDEYILLLLNKTIKKVSEDIEKMRFNTAISSLMIMSNEMDKLDKIPKEMIEKFVLLLYPFAPFISEELWESFGNKDFIHQEKFPEYNEKYIEDENVVTAVQINGKTRGTIEVNKGTDEDDVIRIILESDKFDRYKDKISDAKKTIFVKDKIINFIT